MTRVTAYESTMRRLHDTYADYSWERHGNGAHTVEVFPPVIGLEHAIGPVQVLRFREDGSRKS